MRRLHPPLAAPSLKVQKGQKVGVVGLGGLGYMGVKLAHAMGAHVVLFTSSPSKVDDAKRLGADEVVISKEANQMNKHRDSVDFIVDTVRPPTTSALSSAW